MPRNDRLGFFRAYPARMTFWTDLQTRNRGIATCSTDTETKGFTMPRLSRGRSSLIPTDMPQLDSELIGAKRQANFQFVKHGRNSSRGISSAARAEIRECGSEWFLDSTRVWKPRHLCRQWRSCPICMEQKARLRAEAYTNSVAKYLATEKRQRAGFACFLITQFNGETIEDQRQQYRQCVSFFKWWRHRKNNRNLGRTGSIDRLGPLCMGMHFKRSRVTGEISVHAHGMVAIHSRKSGRHAFEEILAALKNRFGSELGSIRNDVDCKHAKDEFRLSSSAIDLRLGLNSNVIQRKAAYNYNFFQMKPPLFPAQKTAAGIRNLAIEYANDLLEVYPMIKNSGELGGCLLGQVGESRRLAIYPPCIGKMYRRVFINTQGKVTPVHLPANYLATNPIRQPQPESIPAI